MFIFISILYLFYCHCRSHIYHETLFLWIHTAWTVLIVNVVYVHFVWGINSLESIIPFLIFLETSNWTTEEINKFQERLKAHDRDFMQVSLDLRSCGMNKSVKACVEFYYVWKHMNNSKDVNLYRVKSRKRLLTRNNTPQHEEDNYPPVIDAYPAAQPAEEVPYNLRRKYVSANQVPHWSEFLYLAFRFRKWRNLSIIMDPEHRVVARLENLVHPFRRYWKTFQYWPTKLPRNLDCHITAHNVTGIHVFV